MLCLQIQSIIVIYWQGWSLGQESWFGNTENAHPRRLKREWNPVPSDEGQCTGQTLGFASVCMRGISVWMETNGVNREQNQLP